MQVAMQNSKLGKSMTNVILSLICLTTNAFALELNDETKQVIANEFLKCAYSTEKISQKKSALCGCTMDGVYRKYSLKQLQTNAQAILQEEQKTCMDLLK
jgi:dGTP triphosphohydrolase